MRLSLAQFDVTRAEPARNLERITELVQQAAEAGSELICFPEMATTGFDWEFNRSHLPHASSDITVLRELAQAHQIAICGSFLEQTERGHAANTFHYIEASGQVLARYRKLHLFTLFHEDVHVEAGQEAVVFSTGEATAAASVCYDLRFPELFRKNTEAGAMLHLLPAAFPHPRLDHWQTLIRARAIENQCFFVAVNQSGYEAHSGAVGTTQYFGHSMVVDPWGDIIAEAGETDELLHVEIDWTLVATVREKLTALKDRRRGLF